MTTVSGVTCDCFSYMDGHGHHKLATDLHQINNCNISHKQGKHPALKRGNILRTVKGTMYA